MADRDDLNLNYELTGYLEAFAEGERREASPQRAVTGPGRAPHMTVMDPDLAAYLGEFSADTPSTGSSSTQTGAQQPIGVRVVQRALNVLTRSRLAEDNDYGPLTAGALSNWINTLPPSARQNVTVVPSTDRQWLFITPQIIVQTLNEAGTRAAPRPATTQSTTSVGGAAQVLLNAYNKASGFAEATKRYADAHDGQIPNAWLSAYVEWFRSVVALQNVVVNRLRTDPALQNWIAMREGGAHIPSQMATEIESARPPLPDIAQMQATLGSPWLIALGIVAAAIAIPLVAHEVGLSNIAANRTAQLEAIIRGVGEGNLPPDQIPDLPGGPNEDPSETEPPGPFDWLPWTIGAIAVAGVVGLVWYGYTTRDQGRTQVVVGGRGTAELPDGDDYEEDE